ncbi:MAG: 3D domain-containing protein [Actinomycetota bacterium]|nr:3D domain-containing protein [Actinomycetota bacterium]
MIYKAGKKHILKRSGFSIVTFLKRIIFITAVISIFISLLLVSPKKIDAVTLQELGNAIATLSQNEEDLLEKIFISETEIENKRNTLESLDRELEELENQLDELNKEKIELVKSIENKKEILEEKIIFSYKYGNDDVKKLIISARDLNEVINNLYLFKNIMRREAEIIEELRFEKEEYDRISRKSEEKMKEVESTRAKIQEEENELARSIEENKVLLSQVKSEKGDIQNLLAEIKKRIAMIQPPGLTLIGEWDMVATAYYAFGKGGNDINGDGITAIGLRARKGIVAVDPKIIPLGTRLYIPGYGEALAADTGGWIKGSRIDLCFETLQECFGYGRRKIKIYLIEN